MSEKLFTILVLIVFSLILFNSVNALIIYLRPPKMVIRLNTSDTVERSLIVENHNNISLEINATVTGNISQVITIKNPYFKMEPNDSKTIDFVTKVSDPGAYIGQIIVTYTSGVIKSVQVPSDITVMAYGDSSQNIYIFILAIILAILLIVSLIVNNKRGKKR